REDEEEHQEREACHRQPTVPAFWSHRRGRHQMRARLEREVRQWHTPVAIRVGGWNPDAIFVERHQNRGTGHALSDDRVWKSAQLRAVSRYGDGGPRRVGVMNVRKI